MTAGLVEWLRLQLDDDAGAARKAARLRASWSVGGGYEETGPTKVLGEDGYVIVEDDTDWAAEIVTHIARWDPARVLREVQAKRKILDEHHPIEQRGPWYEGTGYETEIVCAMCVWVGDDVDGGGNRWRPREHAEWPCQTVLSLVAMYSDRPGYREEWES